MKIARRDAHANTFGLPRLRFESHQLTSFSGLVLIQQLFAALDLKRRVTGCFRHLSGGQVFGPGRVFLQLVLHLLLGFRDLRDQVYYRHDPLLLRLLGQHRLPDVATISRQLRRIDEHARRRLRRLLRQIVLQRLTQLALARVTIDLDGVVQSCARRAEGTAVGFNPKKKGQRSYYPLFATIAQTQQVLDFLHRSGNVHDSHGARPFILDCVRQVRSSLPHAVIEVRMDAAFFSDELVRTLDEMGVEFTISVPFERFPALKQRIEDRRAWNPIDDRRDGFHAWWKPNSWRFHHRFVFVRTERDVPHKGPLQLELFEPRDRVYEYKVIVTNKDLGLRHVVAFHDGRAQQENLFGQISSQCHMQHVPTRRRAGNEAFLLAGVLSQNLLRELQMRTEPKQRATTPSRTPLWSFLHPQTWRNRWLHRAGRLTRPAGRLTLTISGDAQIEASFTRMLNRIERQRPAA